MADGQVQNYSALADKPVILRIRTAQRDAPLAITVRLDRKDRHPGVVLRSLILDRSGRGKFFGWMPVDLNGISVVSDSIGTLPFDVRRLSYAELITRLAFYSLKTVVRAFHLLFRGNVRGFQYRIVRLLDSMNAPEYSQWRALNCGSATRITDLNYRPTVYYTITGAGPGVDESRSSLQKQTYQNIREVSLAPPASADSNNDAVWLRVPAGVTLDTNAVSEIIRPLSEPGIVAAYCDEDYVDPKTRRVTPFFKPAFNPPLAQSGWLAPDGAAIKLSALPSGQDLIQCSAGELLLAASKKGQVAHVPLPLLHRCGGKPPAKIGVKPALENAWSISVIVPTRDRADLLKVCLEGLIYRTSNVSLDIVVIDNDSSDQDALLLMDRWEKTDKIRRISMPGVFNFSKACNIGVQAAKNELVLLLNNDVEPINSDWLGQMAAELDDETIGVTGALLLFPDGFVQHGGVTLGAGSVARHTFHFRHPKAGEDFGLLAQRREVSAVTGACLLTRKTLWNSVGGMDEEFLKVAFNDVDYCLKVLMSGHKIIWTPYACLTHLESVSRRGDDTPEKKARFAAEEKYMHEHWGKLLLSDPYYNPNLSFSGEDYVVDAIPRQRDYRLPDVRSITAGGA